MTQTIAPPNPSSNIIVEPSKDFSTPLGISSSIGGLTISVASAADTIMPWGANPRMRDAQLRAFWPTESMFASALFTTVAQYVAFGWSLSGPPRTVQLSQRVLNNVQGGAGWSALMTPFLIDMFTQDNGAFMEIVRTDDRPDAPCISLNHLDSYRCLRTGRHETPVVYVDVEGNHHLLKWYQVISMTEMPAPQEDARGMQYCALTRILRTAQTMRDIAVVKHEKASGRFTRQVHLVSGVQTSRIEDAMVQNQADADSMGLMRFIKPLILASLDPNARVTKETIDLASIPDDWDEEKSQKTYILALALALGIDYQSLSPLPGGGLGSGSESKVLNMKARGKGPALFMKNVERLFNFHGVLPRAVTFDYGEQDIAEQMERTSLRKERALTREIMIRSGEITTEVARQMAADDGDLEEHYIRMMREANATDEITVPSTVPASEFSHSHPVTLGLPGPKEPPGTNAKPPAPPNNNDERNRAPSQSQKRNPGGTPSGGAA